MTLNRKLIIIFTVIFFVFAIGACIINSIQPDEKIAVIKINGKDTHQIDLTVERDFSIKTEYGTNNVSIKDGAIYMKSSDCPDKLCVRHGQLQNKYDAIVCLPNKLVIEYKNGKTLDAVAGR